MGEKLLTQAPKVIRDQLCIEETHLASTARTFVKWLRLKERKEAGYWMIRASGLDLLNGDVLAMYKFG